MNEQRLNRRQFAGGAVLASAAGYGRVLGANDRIRVAVIGCGGRGLLGEVLGARLDTNAEVVAICDTWRPQREKAVAQVKEQTGKEPLAFIRFQDVLARKDIDAVLISTPDHLHCAMLIAAIKAGKDVYIEKPMAMNMEELIAAVDVVKASDRVVQVGTQIRSLPQAVAARQFVASGGLGMRLKAEQSRNGYQPYWWPRGQVPVQESDVDWDAFLLTRPRRPFNANLYAGWYGHREFSRGGHAGQGVHFFDLVHYVFNSGCPSRVVAMGGTFRWKGPYDAPDSIEVTLEYPEGFMVRYGQFFGLGAGNYLNFYGTRGAIDGARWSWDGQWDISGRGSNEPDRIPEGAKLPRAASVPHMKNFLECIRTRKQPNAPIDAGYSHSVAAIMADEAYLRGERLVYDAKTRSIRKG
ncbi:MAG TPA: Gfo/Idh/MocA family oxidoreductase [Bryobacteraceae bacterium]|nr:Gfo/Idh/MocA family oxidoreductase [Bryobacteraceae bacterium]